MMMGWNTAMESEYTFSCVVESVGTKRSPSQKAIMLPNRKFDFSCHIFA